MNKIQHKVEGQKSWKHPRPRVIIKEVTDGVWLIEVDFYTRAAEVIGSGSDGEKWNEGLIVEDTSQEDSFLHVWFDFPEDGYLFGQQNKSTWRGTFYAYSRYCAIHDKMEALESTGLKDKDGKDILVGDTIINDKNQSS